MTSAKRKNTTDNWQLSSREKPQLKQQPAQILQTDLVDHPAIKIWAELRPSRAMPEQIEILKERTSRAVYRLIGVGPGNSAVIAKRCRYETAVIERAVYEEILPQIPVPTPHFYGFLEDADPSFAWLFLEDVGDLRYSPFVEEHRNLAARWLGTMHTVAEGMNVKAALPYRGPDYYLTYLRSIRETIPQIRTISSLKPTDQTILHNIISMCELLKAYWEKVEVFCDLMPRTFIHGDCLVKNVHVRMTQTGLTIAPLDWGDAGWGLPATDLGQLGLPYRDVPLTDPDYLNYMSAVRDRWPRLDIQMVQQLANFGQMFWALKVISLGISEFGYKGAHIESIMDKFRVYRSVLANTIRAAKWGN